MPPAALRAALDKLAGGSRSRRRGPARHAAARDRLNAAIMPRSRPCAGFATISRPRSRSSPDMIVLEGLPALSPFRRERLEARLQALSPVRPRRRRLARLLGRARGRRSAGPRRAAPHPRRPTTRPGRRAPATRIALRRRRAWARCRPGPARPPNCCTAPACRCKRVERGMRIDLAGWPADAATQAALAKVAARSDDAVAAGRARRRRRAVRHAGARRTRTHPAGATWKRPTRASAWPWPTTRSTTCARASANSAAIRPTSS